MHTRYDRCAQVFTSAIAIAAILWSNAKSPEPTLDGVNDFVAFGSTYNRDNPRIENAYVGIDSTTETNRLNVSFAGGSWTIIRLSL
jgi:hypothetical protein